MNPDLKLGNFGAGLDINIILPADKKPSDIDNVVVRYVEYDTGRWGARYGVLSGITLGKGLLMSNYSSTNQQYVVPSNKQVGVKAYYNTGRLGWTAIGTWSKLYALRLTEKIPEMFNGMPLTFGQTFVTDSDGVFNSSGTTRIIESQTGYSADATLELVPNLFDLYSEYAKLTNYGSAFTTGLGFQFGTFAWTNEYRIVDANFVPGYFNEQYEIAPVNINNLTGETKNGYRSAISFLFPQLIDLGIVYESYESYNKTNPSLEARLSANLPQAQISATYSQPNFADIANLDSKNATIYADINYLTPQGQTVVIHYKKVYIDKNTFNESYTIGAQMKLF
jgi:hypothetical protein